MKKECFITTMAFTLLITIANAQKLPNIQGTGLRAPVNIKIDGIASEWGEFQAYNKATDVYYTIANDDDKLYLVVQATRPRIIEKIIAVGILFTVNSKDSKNNKAKENASVTFPLLSVPDGQRIISASGVKTFNATIQQSGSTNDRATIVKQSDSVIALANKLLVRASSTIKVKGLNGIADTLISVYNMQRIKAVAAFDNKSAYIYELAIPLKYLRLSLSDPHQFSYNLKLISRLDDFKKGTVMVYKYGKGDEQIDANLDLDSTTDFWGEYTLAKK